MRLSFLFFALLPFVAGCALLPPDPLPPLHERVWVESELTWPTGTPRPERSTLETDIPCITPSDEDRDTLFAGLNGAISGYDAATQFPRFRSPRGTRLLVWVNNDSGDPSPYYASSITVYCYPADWRTRSRGRGLSSLDVGYLRLARDTTQPCGWKDVTRERLPQVVIRPASVVEEESVRAGPARPSWYWSGHITTTWRPFPTTYDHCRPRHYDSHCRLR